MPIYRYRCSNCGMEIEKILPIRDRDNPFVCDCDGKMWRIMVAPCLIVMAIKGTDKILNTLNSERKGLRSKRSQNALARGLDQPRPVIGRGF